MDDSSLTKLRLAVLATSPALDPDKADAFFEESTARLDEQARLQALYKRLPEPEVACAMLLDLVEAEVARLEPLRDAIWEEQDGPSRREAEDIRLVDTSPRGARAHRYEAANESSLHRSVNLLIRLRRIEPEQQTIDRWSKKGIDRGRRWDGTKWVYLGPERPGSSEPPVYEPGMRNEANYSDASQYKESACDDSAMGSPTATGGFPEAGGTIGSEVGGALPAIPAVGQQPAAQTDLRNEAKSADASHCEKAAYDDTTMRSQTASGSSIDAEQGAREVAPAGPVDASSPPKTAADGLQASSEGPASRSDA
jgi:hypothetical protein